MNDETRNVDAVDSYLPMGLVANPFVVREERPGAARPVLLEMQAEANALQAHLVAAAETGRSALIWVTKSNEIASFFHTFAQSDVEQRMLVDDTLGMLPCYVQLYMARVGRIRSALNVLAERLATRSFELTLAELARTIASEPDTDLPAWKEMDPAAWQEFITALDADAPSAVRGCFGEYVLQRASVEIPPTDIREVSLEIEPEESDDTPETDSFTETLPSGEVPQADDPQSQVRAFIVAHTRSHFSPVIARALKSYADEGYGQLIQELKITRAPRKTFKALIHLASLRYRRVVFIYDGLENWSAVPEDLQVKYIASLTEIRAMAGRYGTVVFLAEEGAAPELEDQFGIGQRIDWSFPHLTKINEKPGVVDTAAIQHWLDAATIPGRGRGHSLEQDGWTTLLEAASGDMEYFCALAAEAVERAAGRGLAEVDRAVASEVVEELAKDEESEGA